jgi:hypothetical protein
MKKVIFLMMSIILAAWINAGAQDDPFDPIIKALQESDAKSLSAYFNITIELRLPDNENTYSTSQAEMIMKDFFKKYPPDSLTLVQQGSTDAVSMFAICNYQSGSRQYQVYINLRKEKDKYLIQKIKFEEKK